MTSHWVLSLLAVHRGSHSSEKSDRPQPVGVKAEEALPPGPRAPGCPSLPWPLPCVAVSCCFCSPSSKAIFYPAASCSILSLGPREPGQCVREGTPPRSPCALRGNAAWGHGERGGDCKPRTGAWQPPGLPSPSQAVPTLSGPTRTADLRSPPRISCTCSPSS